MFHTVEQQYLVLLFFNYCVYLSKRFRKLELIRRELAVIYLGIQSIFYNVSVNQVNFVYLKSQHRIS